MLPDAQLNLLEQFHRWSPTDQLLFIQLSSGVIGVHEKIGEIHHILGECLKEGDPLDSPILQETIEEIRLCLDRLEKTLKSENIAEERKVLAEEPLYTPAAFCKEYGLKILNPDGWRGEHSRPISDPISFREFVNRFALSTVNLNWSLRFKARFQECCAPDTFFEEYAKIKQQSGEITEEDLGYKISSPSYSRSCSNCGQAIHQSNSVGIVLVVLLLLS